MATGVDFVLMPRTTPQIVGSAIATGPIVVALDSGPARSVTARGPGGTGNGNFLLDGFSTAGFAKNGCFHATTTGTTAVQVDLTALATNATSQAGDATFGTWNKIRVYNCGAAAMTVGPGGSNPASLGLGGTSPTMAVPAGSFATIEAPAAGTTVDSTHKMLTITPTAGGDVMVGVGGS